MEALTIANSKHLLPAELHDKRGRLFDVSEDEEKRCFIVVTYPSGLDTRAQAVFFAAETGCKKLATFLQDPKPPRVSQLTCYYDLDLNRLGLQVDEKWVKFQHGDQHTLLIYVKKVENAIATLDP